MTQNAEKLIETAKGGLSQTTLFCWFKSKKNDLSFICSSLTSLISSFYFFYFDILFIGLNISIGLIIIQ